MTAPDIARSSVSADHADHEEQGGMISRCVIRRNRRTADIRLRAVVTRVNVA
ncbi:hypothetical protein ACIOEW_35560 [Streptomyces sp. NPDC087901]|uniref:hypothetical protein n=1 Tax=Streptomyces sp. NPDC087901 TaxID=3365818 RepID=UPI00381C2202